MRARLLARPRWLIAPSPGADWSVGLSRRAMPSPRKARKAPPASHACKWLPELALLVWTG